MAAPDPITVALLTLAEAQGELEAVGSVHARAAAHVIEGLLAQLQKADGIEAITEAGKVLRGGGPKPSQWGPAVAELRDAVRRELAGDPIKPGGARRAPQLDAQHLARILENARGMSRDAAELLPLQGTAEERVTAWASEIFKVLDPSEPPAILAEKVVSACMSRSGFHRPSRVDDAERAKAKRSK